MLYNILLMNNKNKILIFFLVVIVYFSILVLVFIHFINIPVVGNKERKVGINSKINIVASVNYFNPFNFKTQNSSISSTSSGKVIQSNIVANFASIKNETIIYFVHKQWKYTINATNTLFKKDNVIVYYKKNGHNTLLEIYIPNSFKISDLVSLFDVNYSTYSYPFDYTQMNDTLASLDTTYTPYIRSTSFVFYKNNFNNVGHFQYNTPIEEIKGVSMINTSSQGSINSLLHEYMSRFSIWGYIPFTVYGAIIDNNTIYYLKYGLGGASIKVLVKPENGYSFVYYSIKVSASSSNNNLSLFNRLGWSSVFN